MYNTQVQSFIPTHQYITIAMAYPPYIITPTKESRELINIRLLDEFIGKRHDCTKCIKISIAVANWFNQKLLSAKCLCGSRSEKINYYRLICVHFYTQKILSNAQSIVVWWLAVIETGEGKQFLAHCYAKNTLLCLRIHCYAKIYINMLISTLVCWKYIAMLKDRLGC